MNKKIILLVILSGFFPSLFANSYSWTGMHVKLLPSVSNIKLNYSGGTPYTMYLKELSSYYIGYYSSPREYTVAENISANTLGIDVTGEVSKEISDNFGILGELAISLGRSSNFIASSAAIIWRTHLAAGIFYHQPLFRIAAIAGIGFGKDIFGYPNLIEKLESGAKIRFPERESFINASSGLTYIGTIGVDFKISDGILLGARYSYTRSKTTAELENSENFYISNHSISIGIGVDLL